MRSSISNSDAGKRWRRVWQLAAVITLAALVAWESSLRFAGLEPEFTDNRPLWLSARHKLAMPDPGAIALLGASRMQRAVDANELGKILQRTVVQLAVEGTSSMPVLENLAADPRFRGTVIVSITPPISFNRKLSKLDVGKQSVWVREYINQSRSQRMEQELRLFVQGKLSFRSLDASVPMSVAAILDSGSLPEPDYKKTFRDRYVAIDMSRFETVNDQDAMVELYIQNTDAYEDKGFKELLQYFSTVIDILNNKGCRVYLLRLPSEGKVLEYENENFPEDRFWSELKKSVNARSIHFDDYPQLTGHLSMDGSHVAADKATDFTALLAQILTENGI